uniref:Uncharacterized protein n=1 Tax=Triticum urartu TaxID=4572 RepID=A0A8R7UTM6_TRIUA
MRAAIYKGASSEDGRSKSSSDRSGFWRSNNASSKGSDAPSWRKNLHSTEGHRKINGGEGDVTSPLKIAIGDQTEPTRGKKLVFEEEEEERKSEPFSERGHKEEAGSKVTNETTTQPCQHGSSERTHDGKGKKVEIEEREERLVQKSETKGKQTTLRRVNKPKGKQQRVPLILGPKKKFVGYMEFDDEAEFSKKARMEIDGEEEG